MASRVYRHQQRKLAPSTSRRPRGLAVARSAQAQIVAVSPNGQVTTAQRQRSASRRYGSDSTLHGGMIGALFAATQDALAGLRKAAMDSFSELLFARPSFLQGMARLFDLGDTLSEYNSSLSPEQADRLAIASDWRAIGLDMWRAIDEYTAEHEDKREN